MKHNYIFLVGILFLLTPPVFSASGETGRSEVQLSADPTEGSCGRQANYNMDSTNLMWSIDTSTRTLTITGKGRMRDYDNDTKAPWYPWRNYISKAVFPEGMTTVGSIAMWNLTQLTEVDWGGNTVEIIYNSAFSGCTSLPKINLPNSLHTISVGAFSGCTALKSVEIPNSVTTLDNRAFASCSSLEKVTLPNQLKKLNWRVFYGCTSLKQLTLPNSITAINRCVFGYCSSLEKITWSESLTSIGDSAFIGCTSFKQMSFPASLTSIGYRAFYNCTNIETIDFGDAPVVISNEAFYPASSLVTIKSKHITNIHTKAFGECTKLVNLDLGESLTAIYNQAFLNCWSLQKIHFPASLKEFVPKCFEYCYSLDQITVDSENQTYDSRNNCNAVIRTADNMLVFGCAKTVIPAGTNSIGSYAFYHCNRLEKITIPEGVQTIASNAFEDCAKLNSVIFPKSLTSIGPNAFDACTELSSVIFQEGLTSIGASAFEDCAKLSSVILPTSLISIGVNAFKNCDELTSVVLPEGLQSLGDGAFYSCNKLSSVSFPNSVTSVGCGPFKYCNQLKTAVYNTNYFVYLPRDYKGSYTIPGSPKIIACQAFEDCDGLSEVIIPASVIDVGSYSFQYSDSLKKADLPSDVTRIGKCAFRGCSSLAQTVIPTGVTAILDSTYNSCSRLQSATLSERLKSIGKAAFSGCSSLQSILIPDSVTSIGQYAFYYCQSLTSISFPADLNSLGGGIIDGCTGLHTIIWNVRTSSFNNGDPFQGVRGQITDFVIGDSVRVIPANMCYEMSKLSSISLGCNIQTIGTDAFKGCSGIKSIHWNLRRYKDVHMYYDALFYSLRSNITSFTFGDSVLHIPSYLCYEMNRLRQVHIPAKVSSIGNFAFRYVSSLDSISVDEDNEHYDSRNNCNALIDTDSDVLLLGCYKTQFPDDISGIGEYAFRNVRRLSSVVLPESVTFVGPEAFNGCKNLKAVSLSSHIETIDDYAFQNCDSLLRVTLPADLKEVGQRAFANCTGLEAILVDATTPPTIVATSFSETSCPFYVPCGTIDTYRRSPVWSDYGTRLAGQYFFTLTIEQNDYSFGRTIIVQKPDCEHNAIVEAYPERGYQFVAWQDKDGQVLSTGRRYEFKMEEDVTLLAVFERAQGLDEVLQDASAVWYDIMGHRVSSPTSGVYIVQQGSQTYKVVIP